MEQMSPSTFYDLVEIENEELKKKSGEGQFNYDVKGA